MKRVWLKMVWCLAVVGACGPSEAEAICITNGGDWVIVRTEPSTRVIIVGKIPVTQQYIRDVYDCKYPRPFRRAPRRNPESGR